MSHKIATEDGRLMLKWYVVGKAPEVARPFNRDLLNVRGIVNLCKPAETPILTPLYRDPLNAMFGM